MKRALPLLLLLGCATPAGHEHGPDAAPQASAPTTTWTCPMHPSIVQATPGSCPLCGMDLVPVTAQQQASGEVIVDGDRRQKVGIVTAAVTRGPLTRALTAPGTVVYDQNGQAILTTKVDGLVRDPVVLSPGQAVRQGQRLFDLWSPELQSAQAELLAARGSPAEEAARARLQRWDLPKAAIDALLAGGAVDEAPAFLASASGVVTESMVTEGARVMAGEPLYRLARLDPVWVEAAVYPDDVPYLKTGDTVTVRLADQPEAREGRVLLMLPEVDPMTRARKVRVQVDNADGLLLPGMAVTVTRELTLGEGLSVPADAVIFLGERRLVFVDLGEGRLSPRELTLGPRAGERYLVREGLSEGEQVVSEGTFLVAAESRIRSASQVWGHDHARP